MMKWTEGMRIRMVHNCSGLKIGDICTLKMIPQIGDHGTLYAINERTTYNSMVNIPMDCACSCTVNWEPLDNGDWEEILK